MVAHVGKMRSFDTTALGDDPSRFANLYDGYTDAGAARYFGSRSASAGLTSDSEVRAKPPLERIAIRALALCTYLDERTGEGSLVYSYILSMWGIAPAHAPSTPMPKIRHGVGATCFTSYVSSSTHNVNLLPNTKGLVNMEATALFRHSDVQQTLFDAMGAFNCARAAIMIEYQCNRKYDRQQVYKSAVHRAH